MWFVLCHVDVDATYFCKSLEQNVVYACVRKRCVKICFWIYHLASRPGTAEMRIILKHTTKSSVQFDMSCTSP